MIALGFSVDLPKVGRPVVRAVLISDPFGAAQVPALTDISLVEEFDLTTAETDVARICAQLAADVSGRVSTLKPEVVIVRCADFHMSRRPSAGGNLRMFVEGAITAAAMSHSQNVKLRPGAQCAQVSSLDKSALDAAGVALVSKSARGEAAAAALSGILANRI